MTIEQLDIFFLEVKSTLEILEILIGKDIEKVNEKFNLCPKFGIKEKGIQVISKKMTESIDGTFTFFNKKFYKFSVQKGIDDQENNNYLLKIFQKEYGMLSAAFEDENPLLRHRKAMFYTCKKQLKFNNVLVIQFTDSTYTLTGLLSESLRSFNITVLLYNSDMENEVQKKLENPETEIDWFSGLSDSELANIIESTEDNGLYNDKEISFIKHMIEKKQNNEVPTYKQISWFMALFEKFQK